MLTFRNLSEADSVEQVITEVVRESFKKKRRAKLRYAYGCGFAL